MKVYLVATVEIHDPTALKPYIEQVPAVVQQYGGRYLVRGGELEVIEGRWPVRRVTVVEFPSMKQARKWWDSPEYAPYKALRAKATTTNAVFVEGIAEEQAE